MRRISSFSIALVLTLSANVAHAKQKRAPEQGRPHILSGEASQHGDSKNIDFGETAIGGTNKTPSVSEIGAGKHPSDHDFVKIRLRWHPEMVASTSAID
jgi:hypothetical protein